MLCAGVMQVIPVGKELGSRRFIRL